MDVRHSIHPDHAMALYAEELCGHFQIEKVFVPREITLTYSHVDRIIVGGICPVDTPLTFDG